MMSPHEGKHVCLSARSAPFTKLDSKLRMLKKNCGPSVSSNPLSSAVVTSRGMLRVSARLKNQAYLTQSQKPNRDVLKDGECLAARACE